MKLLNIINENEGPIDENLALIFKAAGKNLSRVKGAFDDVFKFAADSGQPFYKSSGKKGGIFQSSDELMKAMKAGKLSSEAATQLAQGLLKTNKCPLDIQKMLVSEIASGPNWRNLLGTIKTEKGLIKRWKGKQYTDETIELMLQKAKDQKIGPYGKTATKNTAKNTAKNTTKTGANTTKTGANTTKTTAQVVDKAKDTVVKLKNGLKWAAGTPLGKLVKRTGKLYLLFRIAKWALVLGGAGYIYTKWDDWFGEGNLDDYTDHDFEPEIDFLKCILIPLSDDEGAEVVKENDTVYLHYKKGSQYDSIGGLIFREDGSVVSGDGSKKGKWTCNTSGLEINEQVSTTDLTSDQLSELMDDLNDNLMGDFFENDSTDMSDSLIIIKKIQGSTYKGVPAIKALIHNYPLVYGNSLSDDLNNLKNLDFSGIEEKREILSILGISEKKDSNKPGDSDVKSDGNTKTGIGHITITWDNDKNDTTPVPGGSVKYMKCNDLPFKYGCINDKIKSIQSCLPAELKPDGYYGPKTSKALWNLYQGKEKSPITKVVFDKVMTDCKKKKTTNTRKKVEPITKLEMKPIVLPQYDTEKVIKQIDPAEMAANIQKTIDGRRVDQIIDNELEYSGGRYVLKIDDELTEKQLKMINLYMASKGFKVLRKKRETLDGSKYVWKADSKDAKRIARRERSIKRNQDKINKIKDNE